MNLATCRPCLNRSGYTKLIVKKEIELSIERSRGLTSSLWIFYIENHLVTGQSQTVFL